jgi:phytoene synthase
VGVTARDPLDVVEHPAVAAACRALAVKAHAHYDAADAVMATATQGRLIAPRLMSAVYGRTLALTEAAGWDAPRTKPKLSRSALLGAVLRTGLKWGWR